MLLHTFSFSALTNRAGASHFLLLTHAFCFPKLEQNFVILGEKNNQTLHSLVWCIVIFFYPISSSNFASVDTLACSTVCLICCPHTHSAAHLHITAPCGLFCLFVEIKDVLRHLVQDNVCPQKTFEPDHLDSICPLRKTSALAGSVSTRHDHSWLLRLPAGILRRLLPECKHVTFICSTLKLIACFNGAWIPPREKYCCYVSVKRKKEKKKRFSNTARIHCVWLFDQASGSKAAVQKIFDTYTDIWLFFLISAHIFSNGVFWCFCNPQVKTEARTKNRGEKKRKSKITTESDCREERETQ